MYHKLLKPSAHLANYIKEYLLIHFKFDNGFVIPTKPYPVCPEQGIIFYIRSGGISIRKQSGCVETLPPTIIFGQSTERHNKQFTDSEFLMFLVAFQPGALHKLAGIPMTDLAEKRIDAESVFGKDIHEVNEKLQNANNYAAMIHIVEAFLWQKIKNVKTSISPIDCLGRFIIENPSDFDLEKLARQTYLSPRQFERKFIQQIGISPKFFARISRFYKAFELKEHNLTLDWSSIAWNTGYTDYQHLVKDFKQFAGRTPNLLLLENAQSPERLIGVQGFTK